MNIHTRSTILFAATLAGLLNATAVAAQYSGPAIEACRQRLAGDLARTDARVHGVTIERDRALLIDETPRRIGGTTVRATLTGHGAIAYTTSAAVEFSFVCLLASERSALHLYWLPRLDASPLAQCTRSPEVKANIDACLDNLVFVAETDLTAVTARYFQETLEHDAKAGNTQASDHWRRASLAWRAYRDEECGRRADIAGTIPAPAVRKACVVELTRQRTRGLLDARGDTP